ncbi:aldo/keto reductase [Kitasatospora sp. NPDC059577]|uniref:aldo/keto reductase n=1 Tax=Kitasatospora sp. NPDC059577 TaxID=3346873 RepID=UPI0036817847
MRTTTLGRTGPTVSAIGLGGLPMAGAYGPAGDPAGIVAHALDLGVTLFDTADYYGRGAGEEVLGRALARRARPGHGSDVVVATKTGILHRDGGPPGLDGSPEHLRRACEASLRRLGTDRIGLYQLARIDPRVPVEESMGAMAELVAAGKVGLVGLCEAAPATLRRAHAVHPVSVLQTEYSLWERHVEAAILPACRELGVTLVAYRPLGSGLLAGRRTDPATLPPGDFRHRDPRFAPGNLGPNLALADALAVLAREAGAEPARLALAWLLAHDGVLPIPGTLDRAHLAADLGAAELRLDEGVLKALEELLPPHGPAGERYPPGLLATVDRG